MKTATTTRATSAKPRKRTPPPIIIKEEMADVLDPTLGARLAPLILDAFAQIQRDGFTTEGDVCAACGTPRQITEEGGELSFCSRCERRAS